ncbi:MAG: polysaccharide deacetylase family protein [Fibrobacter sp.]|nr:polysaccharide deacetylase family protein [Fibrobacter sp.]
MRIIYPYLHIVSDEPLSHLKHLYKYKNTKQFRDDITQLCRKYVPVRLNDIIDKKNSEQVKKTAFLLTIDDGFREVYEIIAPILIKEGVSATFFIASNFIDNKELYFGHKKSLLLEHCISNVSMQSKIALTLIKYKLYNGNVIESLKRINYNTKDVLDIIAHDIHYDFESYLSEKKPYLTTEQIHWLIDKGFSVGAHSINHPRYSIISKEEQVRQTVESVRKIRNKFNLQYGAFAFPHSDSGVSKNVFKKIFESGIVDITFGTAGMIADSECRNVQRFSIEKPLWPIKIILFKEHVRRYYRKVNGLTKISRM